MRAGARSVGLLSEQVGDAGAAEIVRTVEGCLEQARLGGVVVLDPSERDRRLLRHGAPAGPTSRWAVTTSLADGRDGVRHLRGHTALRVVAGTSMLSAGLVSALLTVAVVWLDRLPGAPDGAHGIALAGYPAGAILGLVTAGTIAWRIAVPRLAARTLAVAGVACALGVVGGCCAPPGSRGASSGVRWTSGATHGWWR